MKIQVKFQCLQKQHMFIIEFQADFYIFNPKHIHSEDLHSKSESVKFT